MARVIKIDNVLQKRFSFKIKGVSKSKELVAYFLIVCEGEKTEPNYFNSFPKKVGKVIYDIEFEGGGISTIKVVEKAMEIRKNSKQKYDRVWAVFDRDSFNAASFNGAIAKAEANNIYCAWSNQAFELWYLLHFHNRITTMNRDEYKSALEEAINDKIGRKKTKYKYLKNDQNMYNLLKKLGNQELAIKWASDLSRRMTGGAFANYNPMTKVFELVNELNGNSDTLNEEILLKYNKGE